MGDAMNELVLPVAISVATETVNSPGFTPALNAALAKAQGAMESAKKDTANPFFNTKYADLAGIIEACRKPLSDNGLSIVQIACNDEKGVTILTRLLHSSGESISSPCWVPVVKKDPQGYGSAMTYARRFGLQALVGVAAEVDDDANSHVDPNAKTAKDYTKPKANRAIDTTKLVAAFEALGFTVGQIELRIKKSIAEATEADVADLRSLHTVMKASALLTAAVPSTPEQLAESEKRARFSAFEKFVDRIRAAKTSVEVMLIESESAAEKLFKDGDKKALARTAADRKLVLDDMAKKIRPADSSDVQK